ncbi:MAG TPA: hypothetical protein VMB02_08415 [Candidatus Aquilonibacter sp.]|nr:hypothetical protein [Candidatus Aquilonibacter sp.]
MKDGRVSRKHYFLAVALTFLFVAFSALLVLSVAIDRRYGSDAAMTLAVGAAIAVAIWPAMLVRKPSRPANYPRIEHLRIAGKYASTGAAKVGVSPLHLQ